jgi:hypothetical protein
MRAYQRRRRGVPEADPGVSLVAAVVQPQIMEEIELPAAWANPQPVVANGLESRYWHGTAIKRRQADGFVNATAICQANGREWFTYARSERTKEYIAALASHLGGSPQICGGLSDGSPQNPGTLIQSITTGPNHLRGTWIHPRLAVDLARWISPAFAVWMDGWFLESLTQPQPKPQQLPYGIHVVAATRRHAAELWWEAINEEVQSCMARRLKPTHRTDAGLPLPANYQLHLIST